MSTSNCNCHGLQEFSQPMNIFCKRAKGSYKSTKKKKKKKRKKKKKKKKIRKHSINERKFSSL